MMKTKFLTLFTFLGLMIGATANAATTGDIWDIRPCDEFGVDIAKSDMPVFPKNNTMISGDKAYFKVRFHARENTDERWELVYTGADSTTTSEIFPMQLGIFVSGKLKYATYIGKLNPSSTALTDLVFEYEAEAGDFALPIVLAVDSASGPVPASDLRELNTYAYYLNPLRSEWELRFTLEDTSYVTADWKMMVSAPFPGGVSGVEKISDLTLSKSGFNVETVDFSSSWETNGVVWRLVHEDSTIIDGKALTPQLVSRPETAEKVELYVWSTNEAAVVMAGDNVEPVEMSDPDNPGTTKTYNVAKVTFAKGELTSDFKIRGVSKSANDGWSGLVLSAYNHYNFSDASGDLIEDFITVPVRCTDKMPPSVLVEADREIAYATSDYKNAAAKLTVRLSQSVSESFTVKITPKMSDGTDITSTWGEYVRFSTTSDYGFPDAVLPEVKLGDGIDSAVIYVFCLRGDNHTTGVGELEFVPSSETPPAEITDWRKGSLQVSAQNPVIEAPTEGSTFSAVQFDATPITIRVSDTYADMASDEGYTIFIKYKASDAKFQQLTGAYKPGEGGILYRVDDGSGDLPTLTYTTLGENDSELYVVAPVSGKSSAVDAVYRTFTTTVTPAKSSSVTVSPDQTEFNEGEKATFTFHLSEAYDGTESQIYAFLKPTGITSTDQFSGGSFVIGMKNCKGRPIARGKTETSGSLTFQDGYDVGDGGLQVDFEVVLALEENYEQAVKDNKLIRGYNSDILSLVIYNNEPTVERVTMNGIDKVTASGGSMKTKVAKKETQTFKVKVSDTDYDLDHDFQYVWTAYYDEVPQKSGTVSGNPNSATFQYAFPYAGEWTIELALQDKDMDDDPDPQFSFKVTVLDQPTVEIVAQSLVNEYLEPGQDLYIDVGLSMIKADATVKVKLAVSPADEDVTEGDWGELVLSTYDLEFTTAASQSVLVKRLDGTANTLAYGLKITATVVDDTWKDYYLEGAKVMRIRNVAPNNNDAANDTFSPDSNTNRWVVAGGKDESHPLTVTINEDVKRDLETGTTITIVGGGGESYNQDGFVNGKRTTKGAFSYTYNPDFGTSQGDQQVTIIVKDKDGGTLTRTWYYTVTASKMLTMRPNGPTSGYGTTISKKYAAATGLGMGRVWASGFSSESSQVSTFNCGSATGWSIYGLGYKVGDIDDGDALNYHYPDNGVAGKSGYNANFTSKTGYDYSSNEELLDSFLYTFIQISRSESEGDSASLVYTDSLLNGSTSPEYPEKIYTGSTVALPTEMLDDGSYDLTQVEAIFSKEILPADNMGDINWDYIPDVFYDKYEFTVEEESTDQRTGNTTTEDTQLSDLKKLMDYNEDEDFLPALISAAVTVFDPALSNSYPFIAKNELRGFGENFNDATSSRFPDGTVNLCAVNGVKPSKRYTDPTSDDKSTLTKVEYLAWQEYAAAHNLDESDSAAWDNWSPERPTNPTEADTDGDGFEDGFEYYFWYRAHVGYLNEAGEHCHLTGRKFDPRHPGEGTVITPAEIMAIMDPIVDAGVTAYTQDTDNDGLPDLLEFKLGTNPIDFDTDGDGLPDGWEIVMSGTDPLTAYTIEGVLDTTRNYDGDAMAFTTPGLEAAEMPTPLKIEKLTSFAVVDPNGDSAGVQWYVTKNDSLVTTEDITTDPLTVITLASGEKYATSLEVKLAEYPVGTCRLAADLDFTHTFAVDEAGVLGLPARVPAGSLISGKEENVACTVKAITASIESTELNAAWVYGRATSTNSADFGFLAIARQQNLTLKDEKPVWVCAAPSTDRTVAYLHYFVYQEFGFDPRTAWSTTYPTVSRWGVNSDDGTYEGQLYSTQGGYVAYPARTRAFTAYDEFLVMSFFLNNGTLDGESDIVPDALNNPWSTIWNRYTTNPRGPGETEVVEVSTSSEGVSSEVAEVNDNGADTDQDGVPDGWELYVMSGPKSSTGLYIYAKPYAGFKTGLDTTLPSSVFSPFQDSAQSSASDNILYLGASDGLNEFREFGGTDTIAYYAAFAPESSEATIVRDSTDANWLNKFLPTDPWNDDTDGDGITDKNEGAYFVYGTPVDNGKLWSIPGGGLNPCAVDTDLDGLPDGWEKQYKGGTVYSGEDAHYASFTGTVENTGNPLEGYVDGMDGTVMDAYNLPVGSAEQETATWFITTSDGRLMAGTVNRDYDHDGLENWQEYMVGAMRCWRYDDPLTPWTYIASYPQDKMTGVINADAAATQFGCADAGEFWYKTLVDTSSPIYNPHLVTGRMTGSYFSRVTNGWDLAFKDANLDSAQPFAYYMFPHRIGAVAIKDLWGEALADFATANGFKTPTTYIGCSPIDADSDHDGMDDYYELFHGMNPLLGASGVTVPTALSQTSDDDESSSSGTGAVQVQDSTPCDLVYAAWHRSDVANGAGFNALDNTWRGENNEYDFVKCPWLNGMAAADPDGDDIRNQEEALMPLQATTTWHHTDPTPLWMTDTSYTNSLVSMFWRLPVRALQVTLSEDSFTYDGKTYYFRDFDDYVPPAGMNPAYFGTFAPESWNLFNAENENWMFSFEENEGYDSDHDGISDYEELKGNFREATDPIDFDSPRRRQAMYFQGPAHPSVLQTMPQQKEIYPTGRTSYPDDLSFLQYTVECWVYPESANDSTIIERALWVEPSAVGDEEYLRCNFQLAIKNGKWYTKFDSNGTLKDSFVEVYGTGSVELGVWTHLAATFDGQKLTIYVNGSAEAHVGTTLQPAYGSSVIALRLSQNYWKDIEYPLAALVIGASMKTQADGMADGKALNLANACGFDRYKNFYTGFIDEIRVWDGARTATEIKDAMTTRYTAELAKTNRDSFFDTWDAGERRYKKNASGQDYDVPAELRYHYAFDSIFAADNVESLAKVPHGFDHVDGKSIKNRPEGYTVSWWEDILDGYAGTIYNDPTWVTWVPNTIAHLPRFDGTTLDSVFWSEDFKGIVNGAYAFVRTAEPVSRWTQMTYNQVVASKYYQTTSSRHHFVNAGTNTVGNFSSLYEFTGRHLNQCGDDMVALGGAYVKYCDTSMNHGKGMWDDEGASTTWEITGTDSDLDGLPDWWETYADQTYRIGDDHSTPIAWNTIVSHDGLSMTAGEAYIRDLAAGFYRNSLGGVGSDYAKYRQTYDEDKNGLPDWWESMYGLSGISALADSDNDGLSNYTEYLLSEVFKFKGLNFSPIKARSVDQYHPDYFFKIGSLYAGEIFTDHDLVDDVWEDEYATTYASRNKYDAFQDADEDGWSNRSENRYANQSLPIVADQQSHYTAADGLVADYPIPTLALTLRYNGQRQQSVRDAAMVVRVTREQGSDANSEPEAEYVIAGSSTTTGGTGSGLGDSSSDSDEDTNSYTRNLGRWSNRHAIGTLTPGNLMINSISLEFCSDPSSLVYTWKELSAQEVTYSTGLVSVENGSRIKRGTRAEYDSARRKYGSANVELISASTEYSELEDLELKSNEATSEATWIHTRSGKTLGTINLITGAFDLNLGVFKDQYVINSTNSSEVTSLEDQTFRISYSANYSVDMPRKLYLGEATSGYVREGKNTIIVFADLSGDGVFNPGEPYGLARDVDVSWQGTTAEIELTDLSPVTPRIDLVEQTADRLYTRDDYYQQLKDQINSTPMSDEQRVKLIDSLSWMETNLIAEDTSMEEQTARQRIRVVRWLVDGVPTYLVNVPSRVILDKYVETDVRKELTEFDFLGDDVFDLDWQYLKSEVVNSGGAWIKGLAITNMSYLVVVGDGPCEFLSTDDNTYTISALTPIITRKFGVNRVKPTALSPANEIELTASPTFKWKLACDAEEGYTAFRLQIQNAEGKTVYDSETQRAPAVDGEGYYSYQAPFFAGDKTTLGYEILNRTNYTWKVSMYNSKFRDDAYATGGSFFFNIKTNGYEYGAAHVAVKYFGPKETYAGKTIRVRAFESADFTGRPAAGGYVKLPDDAENGVEVAGKYVTANCEVIGLPKGTYYLQAFIDSNNNGLCEKWESMGYYATRNGDAANYLDPVGLKYSDELGYGELATIYIEDADTDNDGLPDGWEYAKFGSLTAKGVELLSETPAGEYLVNTNLSNALVLHENAAVPTAGVAGQALNSISSAGTLALALGLDVPSSATSFAAVIAGEVSEELVEDGVKISGLEIDADGNIVISVEAETETAVNSQSVLAQQVTLARNGLEVTCDVYWRQNLSDSKWELIKSETITVGVEAAKIDTPAAQDGVSGFYKVILH